jgi:hypothetical protein
MRRRFIGSIVGASRILPSTQKVIWQYALVEVLPSNAPQCLWVNKWFRIFMFKTIIPPQFRQNSTIRMSIILGFEQLGDLPLGVSARRFVADNQTEIDAFDLVQTLEKHNVSLPVVLRFPEIMCHRLKTLQVSST